jgi:hypothetical protein
MNKISISFRKKFWNGGQALHLPECEPQFALRLSTPNKGRVKNSAFFFLEKK